MSRAHKFTQGGCYTQRVIYSNIVLKYDCYLIRWWHETFVFCCTVSKQEELDTGCLFPQEVMQYYNYTITGLFAARQYGAKVAIIGNNSQSSLLFKWIYISLFHSCPFFYEHLSCLVLYDLCAIGLFINNIGIRTEN